LALLRRDGPAPFQFAKQKQVEARRAPTLAIDTDDAFDLAALAALDFNSSTLREQVQDALFGA